MIKTSQDQRRPATALPKPTEKRPLPSSPPKKAETGSPDKITLSKETREDKPQNLPNLDALKDDKTANKATDKATDNSKGDNLQAQLKEAEKRGDTESVERIKKELQKLLNPTQPAKENPSAVKAPDSKSLNAAAPASSGNRSTNNPSSAKTNNRKGASNPSGSSKTGGANKAGAGQPAGNPSSGKANNPKGASQAKTGGANEAGAGQQAGNQEVNQFLQKAAAAYGVNPKLLSEIARRESNFNTGGITNNWDSNAKKGTPSKGMFQFIQPTFQAMMPKAKAANPQAWQGVGTNWTDWKAQALTCAWAISSGKGSHWSTYKKALATAGGNPKGPSTA